MMEPDQHDVGQESRGSLAVSTSLDERFYTGGVRPIARVPRYCDGEQKRRPGRKVVQAEDVSTSFVRPRERPVVVDLSNRREVVLAMTSTKRVS